MKLKEHCVIMQPLNVTPKFNIFQVFPSRGDTCLVAP